MNNLYICKTIQMLKIYIGVKMSKYLIKSPYTILVKVAQAGDNEEYRVGDSVIIEDDNGKHIVKVVKSCERINAEPLYTILHKATQQELDNEKNNQVKIDKAFKLCNDCIDKMKLNMKLKKVYANNDASKILFYFTSSTRVDFRELVKKLASEFARTRIEMRQITEREEVAMFGGVGQCGRVCCCADFLEDFGQVAIKMAKNQNIALNPNKVNGFCGKLLCCLGYENQDYIEAMQVMPKVGQVLNLPDGAKGVVHFNHLIKKIVRVEVQDNDEMIIKDFTLEELAQCNDDLPKGYEIIDCDYDKNKFENN